MSQSAPAANSPEPDRTTHARSVQNLQIRLGDDPSEAVQVQISQQAGSVRVTVRSGDPDLTIPLRQDLPGLVENLERRGYHVESASANDPAPANVTHSEVKSQSSENQWYGSEQGNGRPGQNELKSRRKRLATDFRARFQQIQEIN
jgi:hypothetical protein